jgi:hypothetical protein
MSACVTNPKIDVTKFSRAKTIVIEEFPEMNNVAVIGHFFPWLPNTHFTKRSDYFFTVDSDNQLLGKTIPVNNISETGDQVAQNFISNSSKPLPLGQAAAVGAVGGAFAGAIQASAEETQRRALNFTNEIKNVFPNFNLKRDFLQNLVSSIEASGIKVTVNKDGAYRPLRLRWPGNDESGIKYETWQDESASFDADLYMQISPLAFFSADGPLNSYNGNITIGVALYDGKTKKLIGTQILRFENWNSSNSHMKYDSLVKNIDKAVPALQEGLIALIPRIVDIVNKRAAP